MAAVYADASGRLLRFLATQAEEVRYPAAPAGTAFSGRFDEATNAATVALLKSDWNSFSAPNGVLTRNGVAVTINPAGQDFQDRQQAAAILTALAAGTATGAQIQAALRFVIRRLHQQGII